MPYFISSLGYLDRARLLLESGEHASLYHAAFELRAGIEARVRDYLVPHDHITRREKREYRFNQMGKSLKKLTPRNEKIVRCSLLDANRQLLTTLYYTPVDAALRARGQRLGDLLHSARTFHADDDPFWNEVRDFLSDTTERLRLANTGELLGSPLRERGGRRGQLAVAVAAEAAPLLLQQKGNTIFVQVEHLEAYPDELRNRLGGPITG